MTETKRRGRPPKVTKNDDPTTLELKVKEKVDLSLPPLKVIARTLSRTGGATPDGGIPIVEFEQYVISYMNLGYELHTSEIVDSTPNEITILFVLTL